MRRLGRGEVSSNAVGAGMAGTFPFHEGEPACGCRLTTRRSARCPGGTGWTAPNLGPIRFDPTAGADFWQHLGGIRRCSYGPGDRQPCPISRRRRSPRSRPPRPPPGHCRHHSPALRRARALLARVMGSGLAAGHPAARARRRPPNVAHPARPSRSSCLRTTSCATGRPRPSTRVSRCLRGRWPPGPPSRPGRGRRPRPPGPSAHPSPWPGP